MVGREILHLFGFGIRTHHIRLPREDEYTQSFRVVFIRIQTAGLDGKNEGDGE